MRNPVSTFAGATPVFDVYNFFLCLIDWMFILFNKGTTVFFTYHMLRFAWFCRSVYIYIYIYKYKQILNIYIYIIIALHYYC